MMAKRIKFPLEMKDGNKVRTIEEFRTYFDSEIPKDLLNEITPFARVL